MNAYAGSMPRAVPYAPPTVWIKYDRAAVRDHLLEAKAQLLAWRAIPFQRRWAAELQAFRFKLEVSGTCQLEGADFVANELEEAIRAATPEQLLTRSQRQAHAAARTYRSLADLPDDLPVTVDLICRIHRGIVRGCDDDHCEPGALRVAHQNVTFGVPRHRGVEGGQLCREALECLIRQAATTFRDQDPLIQAFALHYHFAAMHPFIDGNGRTARALESLMLQRVGLKGALFVPLSNYYHAHRDGYLAALARARACEHDLTPFLSLALDGIAWQAARSMRSFQTEVARDLFRNLLNDLFERLESTRKRVIVKRQLTLLRELLERNAEVEWSRLYRDMRDRYESRKDPGAALIRDVSRLQELGAIRVRSAPASGSAETRIYVGVNLDWPRTITDSDFFERLERLPKSKTYGALKPTPSPAGPWQPDQASSLGIR